MKQANNNTILGLILVAFTLAFTACTKKLDDRLPTPQAEYNFSKLDSPSKFDGASYTITTGKAIGAPINSAADITKLDDDAFKGISNFPIVEYTAPAELKNIIGDTLFIGRPDGTEYTVQLELDNKNLSVFVIADQKDVSALFQTSAIKLENGLMKFKLYSLPVKYYIIRNVKDAFGKNTSSQNLVQVEDKSEAEVVKLDYLKGTKFTYLSKIDVFPADLFEGNWYYAETIVSTSEEQSGELGGSVNLSNTLESSTKIRFVKSYDKIRALNVNIDEDADTTDDINFGTVLEMPVSWKQYEIKPDGQSLGNEEREFKTTDWKSKQWAQFDFTNVRSGLLDSRAVTVVSNRELVDIQITRDYRSYTIFLRDLNIRVKHSFKKVSESSYTPRLAHKDDMRKFGFFTTYKPFLSNFKVHRPEDLEKKRMINRFNTKDGQIVFHFTKQSPERYRIIGRQAIDSWNETFKAAKVNAKIVLDESFDVELGDIRYSAINIIESASTGGGALGFGPSLTDPQTGEIISATSNLWVTNTEDGIISFIRNYIRQQIGLMNNKGFIGASSPSLDIADELTAPALGSLNPYQTALPKNFRNSIEKAKSHNLTEDVLANISPETLLAEIKKENAEQKEAVLTELRHMHGSMSELIMEKMPDYALKATGHVIGRELAMGVSHADTLQLLEQKCPEVQKYISDLQTIRTTDTSVTNLEDTEHAMLQSCAYKISLNKALGTLVHEIGHNLGLRHNFMGSNDKENFWDTETTGTENVVESSSTMEYPSFGAHRLKIPGKYDIAAIQFGYGQSVQLADGSDLALDPKMNIEQNLVAAGAKAKNYKFCTDENATRYAGAWWSSVIDPKCALWDKGITASEIVDNYAHDYDTSLVTSNYRYDKLWTLGRSGAATAAWRMQTSLLNVKLIYDEWRLILSDYVGLGEEYLENMSAEEYQQTLQAMSTDPNFKDAFTEYFPAAQKAFGMLYEIAFLPNHYCVVKNSDGDFDAVELAEIRQEIYHNQKVSVASCKDPVAADHLNKKYGELAFSIGHEDQDSRFSLDPLDLVESNDVLGIEFDKYFANLMLSARGIYTLKHQAKGFAPNFYDEPIFRSVLQNTILNRLVNGVNVNFLKQSLITSDIAEKATLDTLKLTPEKLNEQIDQVIAQALTDQGVPAEQLDLVLEGVKSNKDQFAAIKLQVLAGINPESQQVVNAYVANKNFVKFKHENSKGLLAELFSTLRNGMMIPGKQNVNSQRANLFASFQTDDQQVIAQASASLPIGGGRAIVTTSPNSLIGIMINKLNEIQVLQQTKAISAEEIAKVNDLQKLIPEVSHTMQEHFDFAAQLTALLPNLGSPALQQMVQTQFNLVLSVVGYYQGQNLDEAALATLMQADAVETYAALSKELGMPQPLPFGLTKELSKPFFDSYADNHAKMLRDHERNKEDYKAQSDLLLSIIFASAG